MLEGTLANRARASHEIPGTTGFHTEEDADVTDLPACDVDDSVEAGGACSRREIAKAILLRDDSQIEYY